MNLFKEWSDLNKIICDWRSRFDICRERLPLCKTKEEAMEVLISEGFDQRYPILPEWLK